jgi:hypothetical protein
MAAHLLVHLLQPQQHAGQKPMHHLQQAHAAGPSRMKALQDSNTQHTTAA